METRLISAQALLSERPLIGKILADYRYANRMGMRELAKVLGVSAPTICRIEERGVMDQATMVKLINLFFGKVRMQDGRRTKERNSHPTTNKVRH